MERSGSSCETTSTGSMAPGATRPIAGPEVGPKRRGRGASTGSANCWQITVLLNGAADGVRGGIDVWRLAPRRIRRSSARWRGPSTGQHVVPGRDAGRSRTPARSMIGRLSYVIGRQPYHPPRPARRTARAGRAPPRPSGAAAARGSMRVVVARRTPSSSRGDSPIGTA